MKRKILSAVIIGLFAANAAIAAGKAPQKSGIEIANMDKAVRAQDDFYLHQNGIWMKNTEIPADRSSWGTFVQLAETVQPQLRALIEEAAAKGGNADAKRTMLRKINAAVADAYPLPDFATFLHEHSLETVAINGGILADDQQRVEDQKNAYG